MEEQLAQARAQLHQAARDMERASRLPPPERTAAVEAAQQQIEAVLQLAPPRGAWNPPVLRTTATEGAGVPQLVEAMELFRGRSYGGTQRSDRAVERWRQHLLALLGEHLLKRAVERSGGEAALETLARNVAERRVNPYTAVRELAARAGG